MAATPIFLVLALGAAPADSARLDSVDTGFPMDLIEELQDETGGAGFLDGLRWLEDHPYDLNRVGASELLALPEVTERDVDAIARFRRENRRFRSVDQLLTMTGGGTRLYRALSPFMTVRGEAVEVKEGLTLRSRAIRSTPDNLSSTGSPLHSYTRMAFGMPPGFEAGGIFEKDAGELTRNAFLGGYVRTRGLWGVVDAIAGDFTLESGQGLVLWGGTAISKSALSASTPRKSARGIVPSRSSDELLFLRGAAATVEFSGGAGRWQGMGFFSRRPLAASMNGSGEITSVLASGTFDTGVLASRRDAVHERLVGGRMGYVFMETASLGFTFIRSDFDRPFKNEDPSRFNGTSQWIGGLDFKFRVGGIAVFGEAARTGPGGTAFVGGMSMSLHDRCSVLFMYRDYSRGYDNVHGSGFGDNGETRNENGVYAGIAWDPSASLRIRCYYDQFRHPAPTTLTPFPASGDDLLLNAEADISRAFRILARYSVRRTESKGDGRDFWSREVHPVTEKIQRRWRLGGTFHPVRRITLGTRIEFSSVGRTGRNDERGLLFYQDVELKPFRALVLTLRLIFYDADSYDARMYEFESDLAGVFSSFPLYGRGKRWYAVARITPSDWFTFSIKFAAGDREGGVTSEAPYYVVKPVSDSRLGVQCDLRL